ncbi:MAG: tRNA (uridine(54)-C5)-methyltransferase TrmA [Halioglobus sp.]|nr:tRNA (uridine(54)-C5)-methyltransferase TrmA [Halioglobus sp.]
MPLSAVQPDHYQALLDAKVAAVCELLAPCEPPPPEVFASPPTGFRMRAEFRVWHDGDALDYVMFRPRDPKTPVPISRFPIADPQIQALMPRLLERLRPCPTLRRKLFQVEFLATLAGEVLVTLIYHRPLEDDWGAAATRLRTELQAHAGSLSIIGRSRKQKLVLGDDYVRETLSVDGTAYHYRQYEQSFTQPNARVNTHMLEWACARAGELPPGDLLELYCGNGNFTLPLSRHFGSVIATEVAKSSTRASRFNLDENGIDNVHLVRLSAEETSEAMAGKREFRRLAELPRPLAQFGLRTLFVDPPRAGLDEQTVAMAAGFDAILYISCNPQTLAQNLVVLHRTHTVSHLALFDQFPYTQHMECGVVLRRR